MELKKRRTLNSKHFLLPNGNIRGDFSVGHVHYFNKLGVGNSKNDFRSIDYTLKWNEEKRGWEFLYHSFNPFLPEYSDQWVEFRDLFDSKDQTIKYRAHSSHTKGRLVMPNEIGIDSETSENCIIYDNAFGQGLDYILYFTTSSLKKVVRIRDGYRGDKNIKLTWDISFPEGKNIKRKDSLSEYEFDKERNKIFDSAKETLIGKDDMSSNNGEEKYTYLKPFMVWDSGKDKQKRQIINVEYSAKDKTITKIIPISFLSESIGDVFTDTTTTYYTGAGDGYVEYTGAGSWDTAHNASSGTAFSYTESGTYYARTDKFPATFNCSRIFFPVNTTALSTDATILSAHFYFFTTDVRDDISIGNIMYLTPTNQASSSTLSAADFNKVTATNYANTISLSPTGSLITRDHTLNAAGLAAITKGGITYFGQRESRDFNDSAPSGGVTYWTAHFSEYASRKPYLSVTYAIYRKFFPTPSFKPY